MRQKVMASIQQRVCDRAQETKHEQDTECSKCKHMQKTAHVHSQESTRTSIP